jgi:hypothetical protein
MQARRVAANCWRSLGVSGASICSSTTLAARWQARSAARPVSGDFSAELVLLRGAGAPDEIPGHEPRLARAAALAYDLPQPPSAQELERISGNWRPYRTWVTLLLRTFLEEQTGEIAGKQSMRGHSTAP